MTRIPIAARGAALAIVGLIAFVLPAGTNAGTGDTQERFADTIAGATVVVVASVAVRPDEGLVLHVEQVLKGISPHQLVFEPPTMAPVLDDGGRAVIAFRDLATIDSRAPTYAWIVAANGAIDPRGLQQYPGLPATLDAMLEFFNITPGTSTPELDNPASPSPEAALPWAAVIGAVGLALGIAVAGVFAFRRRRAG